MSSGPKTNISNIYKRSPFSFPTNNRNEQKNESGILIEIKLQAAPIMAALAPQLFFHREHFTEKKVSCDGSLDSRKRERL